MTFKAKDLMLQLDPRGHFDEPETTCCPCRSTPPQDDGQEEAGPAALQALQRELRAALAAGR